MIEIRYDKRKLIDALQISEESINDKFTDGRTVSALIEERVVKELPNLLSLAKDRGGGIRKIIDVDHKEWELRTISKTGIAFAPSKMIGVGRSFDADGFFERLNEIAGYIVVNTLTFPGQSIFQIDLVPTDNIRSWFNDGSLGKRAKIPSKQMIEILVQFRLDSNRRRFYQWRKKR